MSAFDGLSHIKRVAPASSYGYFFCHISSRNVFALESNWNTYAPIIRDFLRVKFSQIRIFESGNLAVSFIVFSML